MMTCAVMIGPYGDTHVVIMMTRIVVRVPCHG